MILEIIQKVFPTFHELSSFHILSSSEKEIIFIYFLIAEWFVWNSGLLVIIIPHFAERDKNILNENASQ